MLEYIADERGQLATASHHLRNGGDLIVVGSAHQWLFSEFDVAVGHYRRYSLRSLSAVVPSCLTPRTLRYLDSLGVGLSAAKPIILFAPDRHRGARLGSGIASWYGCPGDWTPLLDWQIGKSVVGVWQKA